MLLALDTSTTTASLALVSPGGSPDEPAAVLAELDWSVGQRHSTELLQRLEWLLATTGTRMEQLAHIAVATGPGSFNGLRVALSTAKSLSLALGVPLYGVPTLDVSAWGYAYAQGAIWAIQEAGRGQLYAARYAGPEGSPEGWEPLAGYDVLTPVELGARIQQDGEAALVCGEWRPQTRAALEGALRAGPAPVRFASPLRIRRGIWLAELALARAARGMRDDAAKLEPLYQRRPAIKKDRNRGVRARPAATGGNGASSEREEAPHALHG
jgi:tRNA threonylcarbamoyladenosine biosynthesis protein TsaB